MTGLPKPDTILSLFNEQKCTVVVPIDESPKKIDTQVAAVLSAPEGFRRDVSQSSGNHQEGDQMLKKTRVFVPLLLTLVILTCFVTAPAAAAISSQATGSGYSRFLSSPQSSEPMMLTALMNHAIPGNYANPGRFSTPVNLTAFSVPTGSFLIPGGSTGSTFNFSGLDSSFTSGGSYSTGDDTFDSLFASSTTPGCGWTGSSFG
jgi:hypothetical protein